MNKVILMSCLVLCSFCCINTANAQIWIPDDIAQSTVLIERFRFQYPDDVLEDLDEYEDEKEEFIEATNDNLEKYNNRLDELFKGYRHNYKTVPISKIKELYPDKKQYRYVLKREVFFGKKKALNPTTKKVENKSYFAYRYFFYDRVTRKEYMPYYFSGTQWDQVERIVFWLNKAAAQ